MEFDFWWLPGAALFFALGWLAARRESSRQHPHHQAVLPEAYLRGLQSLLGEDPLRATDAFTELVRHEPDNLELQIALGHLFRRKGETDRAIRVHQNLLARQDLTAERRAALQRELSLDYIKAGLFDRAEQSLQSLRNGPLADEAQKLRLDLAQRVRDWPLAASIALEIVEHDARQGRAGLPPTLLAHLHAEIAQQLVQEGKPDEASLALREAKTVAPDHPRAWIDSCLLSIELGKLSQADEAARFILDRWPEQAASIASPWLNMSEATNHGEGKCFLKAQRFEALEKTYQKAASYDLLTSLLGYIDKAQGPAAAYAFLTAHRAYHRGLLSMLAQIKRRDISAAPHNEQHQDDMTTDPSNARALAAKHADDEALFGEIIKLLEQLALQSAGYVCNHCGFQANRHYWQCPGCNQWDRYPAYRTDEMSRA